MSDNTTSKTTGGIPEDADRGMADVDRLVSWVLLVGFLLVSGAARGVYSSQGLDPSARFEVLERLGGLIFMWYWVRQECKRFQPWYPMDLAFFISLVGLVLVPYYLLRYQGRTGLWKIGLVGLAFAMSYGITVLVHYLLLA